MILPSLNASNCGDILKGSTTILSGNETAIRKNVEIGTIRSEVTGKPVKRSTAKGSSLLSMAKLSRMGRCFILAWFFVWSSAFFASVVKADMIGDIHQLKVLRPVVSFDSVNMVSNLSGVKDSPELLFHNNAVFSDIPLTVSTGMIGHANHNIAIMGNNVSRVKWIGEFKSIVPCDAEQVVSVATKHFCNISHKHPVFGQNLENIGGRDETFITINPVFFHANQDMLLTNSIFDGNFLSGFEFDIFSPQLVGSKRKFSLHENIISPICSISQEENTRYSLNLSEMTRGKDKKPYDNILDIKDFGDRVVIDSVPTITVSKHTKGEKLGNWQNVDSPAVTMYINRATKFEFMMTKIDIAQFQDKGKMNQCAKDAAEQQAIYVDTEALSELYAYADSANQGATAGYRSGFYNLGYTANPIALTESTILRYILMCEAVGDERSWPKSDRWFVLPTWGKFLLNNSDIKDASLTGSGPSNLVNGHRIGRISNFQIYESNLYTAISDTVNCYPIIFGHKSAIAFASQLNDVEYFDKLEGASGKAMRGIQLYDWKVVKPESMGVLYATMG